MTTRNDINHDDDPPASVVNNMLTDTAEAGGSDNKSTTNNNNNESQQEGVAAALPMDWTQLGMGGTAGPPPPVIRYPLDVFSELDVTDGEFVSVGTAGQKITHLGPDFSKLLLEACQQQQDHEQLSNDNNDHGKDKNDDHLSQQNEEEEKEREQGETTTTTSAATILLRKLILRSHMITTMEGLEELQDLELLELYDNHVQALILTPNFSNTLIVLDMSYNDIRDMSPVQTCPHLQEIYLANNKLKTIAGLSGLKELRKLDLGANRIRLMPPDELSGLVQLEELWLGKNKIERIQGLSTFTKLRRLDLQSNRLGKTVNNTTDNDEYRQEAIDQFANISTTLEQLYLAHNGIELVGEWLLGDSTTSSTSRSFVELTVLDLSRNQIGNVNSLGSSTLFPILEELWLSGNHIAEWPAVEQLSTLTTLETLYLEYNPIQTNDPLYRKSLAQLIPQLKQIDATLISAVASNALVGTSGLVSVDRTTTTTTTKANSTAAILRPAFVTTATTAPWVGLESEAARMRCYQEMAIQRAIQQQQQLDHNNGDNSNNNTGIYDPNRDGGNDATTTNNSNNHNADDSDDDSA